ncbi:hypothetical protein R0381_001254 [Jeongeupia wiesaeckerbachi]|uniref:hypothetical protein n=1 Tax=Jeongeupia wiesaeckerbachi TaxID=3051218 RepID=UPI003D801298
MEDKWTSWVNVVMPKFSSCEYQSRPSCAGVLIGERHPGFAGSIDIGDGWFGNKKADRVLDYILKDPDGKVTATVK